MTRTQRFLDIVLTVAGVAVAGTVLYAQFVRPSPRGTRAESYFQKDWEKLAGHGQLVGDASAPVKLLEVIDLECPFCSRFNAIVERVRARYPSDVALIYVHFPIPGHRFAVPAARAVECAGSQGRFQTMVDALYRQQDSLGLKAWASFARQAGVPNVGQFSDCITSTMFDQKIEAARAAASSSGVTGTPTVILNGWRYGNPPSDSELVRAIEELRLGRKPYAEFPSSKLPRR